MIIQVKSFSKQIICVEKDEITDLDIAYSILYDEMKKEYMCEKDRTRERRDGDKAAIPQRVFQSFLLSMENDIHEYVISFQICNV